MSEKPLEKKSQSPLYQQLMTRLKNDITAGVYAGGERIPSEQLLCETYGVSRVTVRKAMFDLVQEGLLVRKQGKGTFVAAKRVERDLQHINSFSQSMIENGHTTASKLISMEWVPATAEDVEKLGVNENDNVLEISRLRMCDGEPVMLEINRFSNRYAYLTESSQEESLYARLAAHGSIPSTGVHDISLGYATTYVSRYLDCEVGTALLLLSEQVMDQHGDPLHLSRQWIRGDRITFRI